MRESEKVYICKQCWNEYINKKCLEWKTNFCSQDCMSDYRRKPKSYCIDCWKELSKKTYKYCNDCSTKWTRNWQWKWWDIECQCSICWKDIYRNRTDYKRWDNYYCSMKCRSKWYSINLSWEKCYNRKWWITKTYNKIRWIYKYRERREKVFNRDLQKCTKCWCWWYIEAHHKKRIKDIIVENNLIWKSQEYLIEFKRLRDVKNWITLCRSCHYLEHKKTYGWYH